MGRRFTGAGRIWHHVTAADTRVSHVLSQHFKMAPDQVSDLLRLGAVYSDKRRIFEDRSLAKGTYLRLHLKPKRFAVSGIDWKARIVHRDRDFVVVNKPAGIPVHASLDNAVENVLECLREVTGETLLVTGRLDTPVAGLVVFARNSGFQKRFNQMLADRQIEKRYRALTETPPPLGRHVHFMEPSERAPRRVSSEKKDGWLLCELEVCAVGKDVEVLLLTGRTHQIRAQLGALRCPILGDKLYGSRESYGPERIALFSAEVAWKMGSESYRFTAQPLWDPRHCERSEAISLS